MKYYKVSFAMIKKTIDLTGCKYLLELHERIRTALNFPEWYGNNWDAFWDLLHKDCEFDYIVVKGSNTVSEDLKQSVQIMKELMEKDKKHWINSSNPVDYEFVD